MRGWLLLERITKGEPIPILDETYDTIVLTHVSDFAKGAMGLFLNEKAYGEAFHITSDELTSWSRALEMIEGELQTQINKVHVSAEDYLRVLPEYEEQIICARNDRPFDNNKIKQVVPSFKCKVDLEEGIIALVDFFKNNIDAYTNCPEMWEERIFWERRINHLLETAGCEGRMHYV